MHIHWSAKHSGNSSGPHGPVQVRPHAPQFSGSEAPRLVSQPSSIVVLQSPQRSLQMKAQMPLEQSLVVFDGAMQALLQQMPSTQFPDEHWFGPEQR